MIQGKIEEMKQRVDEFDLAILRLLQADASRPNREIAAAVNLSAPTVQRRIARLEQEGIIERTVAVIDPAALGTPVTVIVEVTLSDDRSRTIEACKAFFSRAPEVQQCYCVAGSAAFVIILLLPSLDGYETQTARLFGDNENVRSYRTLVVVDRVKVGMELPL